MLVVSYHKINQYGEDIATLGRVDPIIALWGPFVLFAALVGDIIESPYLNGTTIRLDGAVRLAPK